MVKLIFRAGHFFKVVIWCYHHHGQIVDDDQIVDYDDDYVNVVFLILCTR